MRVLMLGWEFPPHISGGLGRACEGLAQGLLKSGAEVVFLMPSERSALRLDFGQPGVQSPVNSSSLGTGSLAVLSETRRQQSAAQRALSARASRETLRLLHVPSSLRPYQTSKTYASTTPFYGADLRSEVDRFLHCAAQMAEGEEFDVIHAHDWMTLPAALLISAQSGKSVVWHVHSSEYDRRATGPGHGPHSSAASQVDTSIVGIEQWGLDAAQHVVCVSRYAANALAANYRLQADKLSIVHNALNPESEGCLRPRPDDGLAREQPLILFLGRLTEQKGPHWFLRAAVHVARNLPGARFVIAGEGDQHPDLLRYANQLGLGPRVHFTGFLRGQDVQRMYAMADVYVMPSLSEPFGIAALEAIHAEVPVVLSKSSGVAEVIPSALTLDPTDSRATAKAILDLCLDPALRARQTQAARLELEPLRWEQSAARLMDIFRGLCP